MKLRRFVRSNSQYQRRATIITTKRNEDKIKNNEISSAIRVTVLIRLLLKTAETDP